MHTLWRRDGAQIYFMVAEPDEAYHETVRKLEFEPIDGGFARCFPADSPHLERIYAHFAGQIGSAHSILPLSEAAPQLCKALMVGNGDRPVT